jgi:murein DD-endopeptidase MepM/ murein hydrolase activator NlpD
MATSSLIANLAIVVAAGACFSQPPKAYGASHHRRASHPLGQDVQPSPQIDDRVADEVAKAKHILDRLDTENFLEDPYLVSSIYYHDNFLTDFPVDRNSADPERRIIGQISRMLTPEVKAHFVRLLHEFWTRCKPLGAAQFVDPVDYAATAGGRRSHRYAVDLFASEGTAVHSASRGIVILADRNWSPDNLFSTTSRKGGNAIIVFDPDDDHFYRYCHLSTVLISARQIVASGQTIGAVGHTGLNASQAGHGQHLHFEVNEYVDGHVRAIDYRQLRNMLQHWRISSRSGISAKAHNASVERRMFFTHVLSVLAVAVVASP